MVLRRGHQLQCRPFIVQRNGAHGAQAVFFAEAFAQEMDGDTGKLKALTEMLSELSASQLTALIQEIEQSASFNHSPNFEL